ncbi:hypothetical protein HW555_009450 [Spodoptera exigua]|uniref:Uncharacterized protein n=1 Tax=Spodoptera exigua TaxID=7107 RepID=A0A835L0R0_SPOEX|nr:hypothetical protein HW555_009450 [Spodoptera exigua]
MGDTCTKKDRQDSGTCIVLRDCQTGLEDLANGVQPMICGFQETEPIVCCFNTTSYTKRVSKPTAAPSSRFNNDEENCRPINPSQTAPKTGRKAFDKCKEYQEKYVYPCERKASLAGGYGRSNNCHHKTDQLISGGEDASLYEFPHMALIGFGMISELDFKCGGSIISERFILTAAHCSSSPQFGPATFVAIGVLRKNEARDQSKIYLIEQFINHPHYRSPSKYDDIALIKTDREMQLNQFTVPACLHTEPEDDSKALATGWGLTQPLARSGAEILQKVILTKFSVEECSDLYKVHRLYRRGFDESTQTCYGDKDMPDSSQGRRTKDTCPVIWKTIEL